MSCHDCSCHLSPPCGPCTTCQHADHPDCPNPCDECTDHEETDDMTDQTPPTHVITSVDQTVRGYPGTVSTCSCGRFRSAWGVRDGSAECDGAAHVRAHTTPEVAPAAATAADQTPATDSERDERLREARVRCAGGWFSTAAEVTFLLDEHDRLTALLADQAATIENLERRLRG